MVFHNGEKMVEGDIRTGLEEVKSIDDRTTLVAVPVWPHIRFGSSVDTLCLSLQLNVFYVNYLLPLSD